MGKLDLSAFDSISHQLNNLWEFYFIDIPPIMKLASGGFDFSSAQNIATLILNAGLGVTYYKYLIQDVNFNPIQNTSFAYDGATHKQYSTEVEQRSDVVINFLETENFAVYSLLKGLHQRKFNETTQSFQVGDPSVLGIVTFYRLAHSLAINERIDKKFEKVNISKFVSSMAKKTKAFQTGQVFVLNGMFLKNFGELSLTYSGSDKLPIAASFGVDEIFSLGTSGFLNLLRTGLTAWNSGSGIVQAFSEPL